MRRWFYRNGTIVCDLQPAPDGWSWHGFVAVPVGHPFYGSIFVDRPIGPALNHVRHVLDVIEIDSKYWWFSFEGSRGEEWPTTCELYAIADELDGLLRI